MEKILGIIAEYNPFHHGHFMHLKQSKQITKADYTICVMSGNFVQRGEPAILDKWIRASNATHHGIDLVIELPTVYATSSAENFARGAISIFNDLKIDYLSFGSECGDLEILKKIASFLENEPSDFKDQLTHHIKSGDSFVKARAKAICHYFENSKKIDDILKNANNILAIEYLKMLGHTHSHITPITIKRSDSNYSSTELASSCASATAIRHHIFKQQLLQIKPFVSESTFSLLEKAHAHQTFVSLGSFHREILYRISTSTLEDLVQIADMDESLARQFMMAVSHSSNIDELIANVKSKYYTQTRIQRVLLSILLQITKQEMALSKTITPYCKVLAFNPEKKEIFSNLKKRNPNLHFVFSASSVLFPNSHFNSDLVNHSSVEMIRKQLLQIDIRASKIYSLALPNEFKISDMDFTKHF